MTKGDWKVIVIIGVGFVLFLAPAFFTTGPEGMGISLGLLFVGFAVWGVRSGSTGFGRGSPTYYRRQNPAMFWFLITFQGFLGLAMAGIGLLALDSSGRVASVLAQAASRGLLIPLLVLAASLVLVALGVARYRKREARRPEQIAGWARRLGFRFDAKGTSFNLGEWRDLERGDVMSFDKSRSTSGPIVRNVVTGRQNDLDIAVLDYENRDLATPFECTAVFVRSPGLSLPVLLLGEEGTGLEEEEITFTGHPKFSRMYSVYGKDQSRVRSIFTPGILDFLSTREGLVVAASGERLLVHRLDDGFVEPDAIPALVEQSVMIAELFKAGR